MSSALRLPPAALAALRCPICRAPLALAEDVCACAACGARFPIVDGVPVLIDEANSLFRIEDFVRRRETTARLHEAGWKQAVKRRLPGLSHNLVARRNYARLAGLLGEDQALTPGPSPNLGGGEGTDALPSPNSGRGAGGEGPLVLVVGSGALGQGMEALLSRPDIQLVESDVSLGRRTTLIADAHDLPFVDGTFDAVIAQAVLEHVLDPQRCVEEMQRVLRPRGLVYAETPFMQQVHEGRYDFTRYTHLGHRRLFRRFEELDSGATAGPGMALGWAWAYFLMGFAGSRRARSLLYLLARFTAFPAKYFDYLLLRRPGSFDAAAGYFFMGRKSEGILADRDLLGLYKGAM